MCDIHPPGTGVDAVVEIKQENDGDDAGGGEGMNNLGNNGNLDEHVLMLRGDVFNC